MQLCEVRVRIMAVEGGAEHEVSMQLKSDNTRAYKINSRKRTAKEVKVHRALHHSCVRAECIVVMIATVHVGGIGACMHRCAGVPKGAWPGPGPCMCRGEAGGDHPTCRRQ